MSEEDQLRRKILERIRNTIQPSGYCSINMREYLASLAGSPGLPSRADDATPIIGRIIHDLYHERLIALGTGLQGSSGAEALSWPFVRLTEYGRKVLEEPTWTPFDPDGYTTALRSLVPSIDDTILRYLAESHRCFQSDCLLASAVMLGGASEKTVLLVIEAYTAALNPADGTAFSAACDKRLAITHKVNTFWKQIEHPKTQNLLPQAAKENLSIAFEHIFHLIRAQRNAAGHPQTGNVERSVLLASFHLFPSYCQKAYMLIDYFQANAGSLSLAVTPP